MTAFSENVQQPKHFEKILAWICIGAGAKHWMRWRNQKLSKPKAHLELNWWAIYRFSPNFKMEAEGLSPTCLCHLITWKKEAYFIFLNYSPSLIFSPQPLKHQVDLLSLHVLHMSFGIFREVLSWPPARLRHHQVALSTIRPHEAIIINDTDNCLSLLDQDCYNYHFLLSWSIVAKFWF